MNAWLGLFLGVLAASTPLLLFIAAKYYMKRTGKRFLLDKKKAVG